MVRDRATGRRFICRWIRSNIADFVSTSLAAVSRSFRSLVTRGVIKCRNRRRVKIVNRKPLTRSRATRAISPATKLANGKSVGFLNVCRSVANRGTADVANY